MNVENRFSLLDEEWLPIEGRGRMSLNQIFSDVTTPNVAGSPVQKIAAFKFLLAIVQSAIPLASEEEWKRLTADSIAESVQTYLESRRDVFWLYGSKPFLQMPAISAAKVLPYGALNPEIACGNTTVLTKSQLQTKPTDAEKACLLLQLQGFATGGKKVDNTVVLTPGYTAKKKGGGAGPSLGFMGHLHTFILGETLMETLRVNLLSSVDIAELKVFTEGLGTAPWDEMPEGEDCSIARKLKHSLMGRLMPMNRFCLLGEDGMQYTEGIRHSDYKEGMADTSIAVSREGKNVRSLWVDPEKRPWRSLTSLMRFLSAVKGETFACPQLQIGLRHSAELGTVRIWSGGLRVSSNAGEQYVTGLDDYVESVIDIDCGYVNEVWFQHFANEMEKLEQISKMLFGCVRGYFADMKVKDSPKAKQASNMYWQQAEQLCETLINQCAANSPEGRLATRRKIFRIAVNIYNMLCPHETPRQLTAWVKHLPNKGKILKN